MTPCGTLEEAVWLSGLFQVVPGSNSSAVLGNSQLVCLLPTGILNVRCLSELLGCLEIVSVECL